MAEVQMKGMEKVYPNGYHAIHDVSIDVADGEFLVLVGPSGCGKSTLLRMIAGLEDISGGELLIGGTIVNDKEPKERDIAMVFQNYALYPHMSVADNIGFSLKLAGLPKDEIRRRVDDVAKILELESQLDKKPSSLSGGQRQRVAMGRAIVRQPAAFLMDEPLSNLDAKLRVQMRAEISQLQSDLGVTTVYVTHDQVEAMTMGDRVAVLKDGYLQQCDTPQNLYDSPANLFVAAFIGSPSMNLYQGQLTVSGGTGTVMLGSQSIEVPASRLQRSPELTDGTRSVVVGIRPEDLEDVAVMSNPPQGSEIKVDIDLIEALGSELMVHGRIDATPVDAGDPDAVESAIKSNIVGRFSPRSPARKGETITVSVDADRMYFFDTDTGKAL